MYPFKKSEAAKLLASDNSYAFVLMTILLPAFEDRLFEEDTDILFADIEDFFDCHLSEESENRINAAITAMTTDLFQTNVNMFRAITLALAEGDIGDIPEGIMEEPDAGEALWAVKEVSLLNGEDMNSPEFQDQFATNVQTYLSELISSVAEDEEDIPDDVDTLEEAIVEPYFDAVIDDNLREVAKQLKAIGVKQEQVVQFLEENGATM